MLPLSNASIPKMLLCLLAALCCIIIYLGWVQLPRIENTWVKFRGVTMVLHGLLLCHSLKHLYNKAEKALGSEGQVHLWISPLLSGRLEVLPLSTGDSLVYLWDVTWVVLPQRINLWWINVRSWWISEILATMCLGLWPELYCLLGSGHLHTISIHISQELYWLFMKVTFL